jgi:invasion protein IalB
MNRVRTRTARLALTVAPGLTFLVLIWPNPAPAQEVDKKSSFGIWPVYCSKEQPPSPSSCAIVAGVVADDNPEAWAKVGFTIAPTGALEMTVRTPRLTYLKGGVSIGFDGRQSGVAYIDKCFNSSCETTVAVSDRFVSHLGTRKKLTVEYQTKESEGVILAFDLADFVLAHSNLQTIAGLSEKVASSLETSQSSGFQGQGLHGSFIFAVERRKGDPALAMENATVGPLNKCGRVPPKVQALVGFSPDSQGPSDHSHMIVENEDQLTRWLDISQACIASSVFWVVPVESEPDRKPVESEPERNKGGAQDKDRNDLLAQSVKEVGLLTVVALLREKNIGNVVYSKSGKERRALGAPSSAEFTPVAKRFGQLTVRP